ncbi:MAG: formate/nitrite transporter family protein [Eubacteriales bacterium]|nr:formate/nitrite transporter family protein [Eubacteriales bacterium]
MKKTFFDAMGAGVFIGLGCFAFVSVDSRIAGAVFFCLGLYSVLFFGVPLYTGRCAYALDKDTHQTPKRLLTMFLGNCVGILLLGLMSLSMKDKALTAASMFSSKIQKSLIETLFSSALCGVCVYIATNAWNKINGAERALGVLLAVPTFILAGFEHCIADVFYMTTYIGVNGFKDILPSLGFIFLATIGNTLGAIIFHNLLNGFEFSKKA